MLASKLRAPCGVKYKGVYQYTYLLLNVVYNYVYISTHVQNIPVFDNITFREVKKDNGYLHTGEFYTALFKQTQTTVLYVKKNGTIYYVFFYVRLVTVNLDNCP